jgi:hypothetical protein
MRLTCQMCLKVIAPGFNCMLEVYCAIRQLVPPMLDACSSVSVL